MESKSRPWRTNIGLRLSAEAGAWLVAHCERENRAMANFIELLVMRERERLSSAPQPRAPLNASLKSRDRP